jgi:plasmid maintenance system killer protein
MKNVIKSFSDMTTKKIYLGESLTKKDRKRIGSLNIEKAKERMMMLATADEKRLLMAVYLHYHALRGTGRYSIDADSRRSPWRITFAWSGDEMVDVELVTIENTH